MFKIIGALFALSMLQFYQQQAVNIIFDYAVQSQIQNGIFNIQTQVWAMEISLRLSNRVSSQNHTILQFSNQLLEVSNIHLDSSDSLNFQNDQTYNLFQIQYFSQQNDEYFYQQKTDGYDWINLIICYQQGFMYIQKDTQIAKIPSYDYSASNQSTINFEQIENNCEVTFTNTNIREVANSTVALSQLVNKQNLLGFYFFPFMSKNRQFVQNVYNPNLPPLLLEEYYQLPTNLFFKYKTNNIYSSLKITFPNFWNTYSFYSVKMAMQFSLIAKLTFESTLQPYVNKIVLYHRNLRYSLDNSQQNFEILLNLSTTINTTFDAVNNILVSCEQLLNVNMSYLENNTLIESLWDNNFQFVPQNKIANISYLQHLKTNYQVGTQNNIFNFYVNGSAQQLINDKARFSKFDQHYCGFDIDQTYPNFYYDIMIQEIIFYQELNINQTQQYIGNNELISIYCNLDDTLPYFQERFLINNNDILALKNCQRLPFQQRCDAFYNCIRCSQGKCIQCSHDFYLVNGVCLQCFYPLIVVDGNCIMPSTTAVSVLEPYKDAQINYIIGNIEQKSYAQGFVNILIVNPQNEVYLQSQYLVKSPNGVFQGNQQWDNILQFFALMIKQEEMQIKTASYLTNLVIDITNNLSVFGCLQNFQHFQGQFVNCVQTCSNGYHLKDKLCTKNHKSCTVQTADNFYNECSQCNTGYIQIQNQSLNISSCIPNQLNLIEFNQISISSQSMSSESYDDSVYVHNSVQYPICNIINDEYLLNNSCVALNKNQANICEKVDSQGNCDVQNSSVKAAGYMTNSNNSLYNYFVDNQSSWIYLKCKKSEMFKSTSKSIAGFQELCFWSEHLSQNRSFVYSCMVLDPNCESCDANNLNLCTSCTSQNLLQFEQHTECGTPLPNCLIHQKYNGEIYCQECQLDYTLVPSDDIPKPIGLCILETTIGCNYYDLSDSDTVVCGHSISCLDGYTQTNLTDPSCVPNEYYLESCSQYTDGTSGDFQCVQCNTDYKCIQQNGTIKQDNLQQTQCLFCLQNSNIIEGCYVYDQNQMCLQCYTTHLFIDNQTCDNNCATYDLLNTSECILCQNGSQLQNGNCYLPVQYCDVLNKVGCEICDLGTSLYIDSDLLQKCSIQLQNCTTVSPNNQRYCDQCNSGYRSFRTSEDYDLCVQNIENCQIYSQTDFYICDTCQIDFRVFQQNSDYDLCVQNIQYCTEYDTQNYLHCNVCQQNYQLSSDKSQCTEIPPENQQNQTNQNSNQNGSQTSQNQSQTIYIELNNQLTVQKILEIPCYTNIQNCIECSAYDCFKCDDNYYLHRNKCLSSCFQLDQFCIQCQQLDYSQCEICQSGFILYDGECMDPCSHSQLKNYCFKNICMQNNPICQECDTNNIHKCSKCGDRYYLDENYYCQFQMELQNIDTQFYQDCQNYCLLCNIEKCRQCTQFFKEVFVQCANPLSQQIIENSQNWLQCQENTLCFYRQKKYNLHCKKCKNTCSMQTKQVLNKFQISFDDNVLLKNDLKSTEFFIFQMDLNRGNQMTIEIQNLSFQHISFQFYDKYLISQSINCMPKPVFQFRIHNENLGYTQMMKVKQKSQNYVIGIFFGSLQIFFPGWLMIYFIGYLQKIEILSFISYTNMNAGQLFAFFNSFSETEMKIISLQQNNYKDFQRQFDLQQFQEHYFNLIDQATVITIASFLMTILFLSAKHIFQHRKNSLKYIFQTLYILIKYQFSIHSYSIIGILQVFLLPKIVRYFIINQSITLKKKLIVGLCDLIISYLILRKLSKHFDFTKLTEKSDRQHLTIFKKEKNRLKDFERIFNFWIALDQSTQLFKGYFLFVFQSNGQFSILVVLLISFLHFTYFLIKMIKIQGFIRITICNYIVSEFLFMVYLVLIYVNSLKKTDDDFNIYLNIIYLCLNLSKLLENFSAIYTIKKLTQNRLSHFDVKQDKSYKLRQTISYYQREFDKRFVSSTKELNNKRLQQQLEHIKYILYSRSKRKDTQYKSKNLDKYSLESKYKKQAYTFLNTKLCSQSMKIAYNVILLIQQKK